MIGLLVKLFVKVALRFVLWCSTSFCMGHRSSRKRAAAASSPPPMTDLVHSDPSKAAEKELKRIDKLFYTYANHSSGLIEPDGIENLCSHLEVAHTDIRMLMLAWKMQAGRQGYFTLEEWRNGAKELEADTLKKLKKALTQLEEEVKSPSNFVNFYAYAFQYCLTENNQKCVDIESICILLDLVLGSRFQPQVASLVEYLKIQKDYKVITIDQWLGFYRFLNEITFPDFSNYDPELGWPLILDDFVDWMKEKQC